MGKQTEPCPRCEGKASKACAACHGRGVWPEGAFRYLDAVTVTAGDDGAPEPLGYKEDLTGMHGVVIGILDDGEATAYNYEVLVEGEGLEPYVLSQNMMGPRDPTTTPNCPACAARLKLAVAARTTGPVSVVWRCEGEDCDAASVAFEFPFDFDFAVFERVTGADSAHFPAVKISHVWTFTLKTDLAMALDDEAAPVDASRDCHDPKYLEAVRVLREHCLLMLNAAPHLPV
jgi:hypothetical protein